MARAPLRVALLNDYEIVLNGIAALLSPCSDRVQVVELDSRMPVVSEVDVVLYDPFGHARGGDIDLSDLVSETPALVVFSWNTDPEAARRSMSRGARAHVSKGVSSEELVSVLERVGAGEVIELDADVNDSPGSGRWPGEDEGLSPREAEVLAWICQGLSNQEITECQAVLWGIDHGMRPDHARTIHPSRSG